LRLRRRRMTTGSPARMMPRRRGTTTGGSCASWDGSTVCPWRAVSKHATRRDLPSTWTRWKKWAWTVSPSRTGCPPTDSGAAIPVPASGCPWSPGGRTIVRASGTHSARQREYPRRPLRYLIAEAQASGHCTSCHPTAGKASRSKDALIRSPRISPRPLPRSATRPDRSADFAACSIPRVCRAVRSFI
jgi:hypothetical protein